MVRFTVSAVSFALLLAITSPCLAQTEHKSNKIEAKSSKGKEKNTKKVTSEPKPMEIFEQSKPKDIPDIPFYDEAGNAHNFEEFYGKVVVLNIWATWCAPCVKEMPDMSVLQKDFKRKNLKVVAISEDFKGVDVVKEFYQTNEITNLAIYLDKKNTLFKALNIISLPTSIILNSEGKEVARAMGYIDWTNPELRAFLDDLTDGRTYKPEQLPQPMQPTAAPAEGTTPEIAPAEPVAPTDEKAPSAPVEPAKDKAPVAPSSKAPIAAPVAPVKTSPADKEKTPAKKSFNLPPESVTVVPASNLIVEPADVAAKIPEDSPRSNARRPANQPIQGK